MGDEADEPVADDRFAVESVADEPVADEPGLGDRLVEEPVAVDRVAEDRVAEGKFAAEPVAEDRVAVGRVAEDRVAVDRVAAEPVAEDTGLGATNVANALLLPLATTPVLPEQVEAGAPSTGYAELSAVGDCEVGVWEMSVGAMRDTEVDEIFVVLTGVAMIEFEGGRSIRISAGDVVKLDAGARTVWTVAEPLRKLYVTPR